MTMILKSVLIARQLMDIFARFAMEQENGYLNKYKDENNKKNKCAGIWYTYYQQ